MFVCTDYFQKPHLSNSSDISCFVDSSFAAESSRSLASTGYQFRRLRIAQARDVDGLDGLRNFTA